jgi:hypothetical protein
VRRQFFVLWFLFLSSAAFAQSPAPIPQTGDAAVADFSGARVFGAPASDAQRTALKIDLKVGLGVAGRPAGDRPSSSTPCGKRCG